MHVWSWLTWVTWGGADLGAMRNALPCVTRCHKGVQRKVIGHISMTKWTFFAVSSDNLLVLTYMEPVGLDIPGWNGLTGGAQRVFVQKLAARGVFWHKNGHFSMANLTFSSDSKADKLVLT